MANESLKANQGRNYGSTMGSEEYGNVGFASPSTSGFFDAALFYRLCDKITSNIFQIAKHGMLNLNRKVTYELKKYHLYCNIVTIANL